MANFDTYLNNKCNVFQLENDLSVSELKGALYSLKTNKSPDYGNISSNMIKSVLTPWKELYIISIIYADDTNLFYPTNDTETLFSTVNRLNVELENISEWFKANKLSLNIKKTNYNLFRESSTKDDLLLKFPDLKISLYAWLDIKTVTWKFRNLEPKNSWVIYPWSLIFFKK